MTKAKKTLAILAIISMISAIAACDNMTTSSNPATNAPSASATSDFDMNSDMDTNTDDTDMVPNPIETAVTDVSKAASEAIDDITPDTSR